MVKCSGNDEISLNVNKNYFNVIGEGINPKVSIDTKLYLKQNLN